MNDNYVYIFEYKKKVLYVGRGKGNRINHVLSKKSHNCYLNEFVNTGYIVNQSKLYKIDEFMPEGRAARLEGNLIKALNPVFNIIGNNSFNMHGIARRYLDCHRYVMMNYYKQSGDFRRLDELYNYFEDWAMVDY